MGKREGAGDPVEEPSDKTLAYAIRMMKYFAVWPMEGGSKLYHACTVLICFNTLVYVLLLSLVYFTEQQDSFALIENTAYILAMLPTFTNVTSLVTKMREYKEVISSIQEFIALRQSHPDDVVKSAVRNFLAQVKKLVRSYLSVSVVSTVCVISKPIIQIIMRILLEGTTNHSPASLTLPLKLLPRVLKAPGWLEFILEYVMQVAMVTMVFPMIILLDLFVCLIIKYASHLLEVLNIVLEQFGQEELDFEMNGNMTARNLGGEINKILSQPQLDNILESKTVHPLEEGECVYMASDVRNARVGRQQSLEEALRQIASLHDGILR
ncbi:hypothetical protein PR048_023029 [Dryococelus australis]|uniref:Odorant receptor n=1 Tax=Dryococelus australis TaxID=614101 RepID=A0ABQ9GT04_9NEOP|nr:hypothetical protein PR048_023029 [Dryococelus australis]